VVSLLQATVSFTIESDKATEEIQKFLEWYINEACSKLEDVGMDVTYNLNVKEL